MKMPQGEVRRAVGMNTGRAMRTGVKIGRGEEELEESRKNEGRQGVLRCVSLAIHFCKFTRGQPRRQIFQGVTVKNFRNSEELYYIRASSFE
ncbi:MAG: hypothetical protein IAF08_11255 [Rhizobacter sp.]|nr:hypothetical protein [Chlorobiales bacterium]